jgi:hypothetical protein
MSKYEIVNIWPKRAKRERAADQAAASEPQQARADRSEHPTVPPALAADPAPGDAPAVGYVWVGRELVRIGRDDLVERGRRRAVGSPFGRTGG